jgi:hypothetical protein
VYGQTLATEATWLHCHDKTTKDTTNTKTVPFDRAAEGGAWRARSAEHKPPDIPARLGFAASARHATGLLRRPAVERPAFW